MIITALVLVLNNLHLAFAKAEEVKEIAQKNVKDMIKNVDETDELLKKSENINDLAKDFEKNAAELGYSHQQAIY